jgi:tetratricopeptide (TPR) repeat protein
MLTIFCSHLEAQDEQIDSLNRVLRSSGEDTVKVNTLIALSKKYFKSAPDEAIQFATQGKILSEKIGFKKGRAISLKNIGIGYYMQGKYIETFDFWNQSMAAFNVIGDKQGVTNILSNLGSIYFDQGNDTKALEYYLKSLKLSEEIGNKLGE